MPEAATMDATTQTGDAKTTTSADTTSLGWRAGLPDDLKTNEAFVPFKTVGDFGKSYLELNTKAKTLETKLADAVPKLPDDASDEDKALYYDALGRPKEAKEYELDCEDKNAPEWTILWKGEFHKLGLTKAQGKALSAAWTKVGTDLMTKHQAAQAAELTAAEQKLRTELGDKYDTNVELAKRMYTKQLGAEFDADFADAPPKARFGMVKLLLKVASLTGEDRSPQGTGTQTTKAPTTFINYDKSPKPPRRG